MRAKFVLVACCLLCCLAGPAAGAESGEPTSVVVVYEGGVNETAIAAAGGTVTGGSAVDVLPARFARVPERAISRIEAHRSVAYVTRDDPVSKATQTVPWGIDRTGAPEGAAAVEGATQANVQVAVVDTGIDHDHEDLAANVEWGINTVGSGTPRTGAVAADDDNGHGTHVAGTVAARNNGVGVVGVAPGVELYSIKTLDETGTGDESDLIQGIDRAVKGPDGTVGTADDADVVSMSLSTEVDSRAIRDAISAAGEEAVLVAAAGNSGDGDPTTDEVEYPAKYDPVIAVAATDREDRVPTWSSDGPAVEIAAPGEDVLSTYPDDSYAVTSGTSTAAPHVAGAVALLVARDLEDGTRSLSTEEIRTRLGTTALDIGAPGTDPRSGAGLLQTGEAVRGESVPLEIAASPANATVGDPVTFTVTRGDTGDPVRATVAVENTTLETDDNGTVTYTFEETGSVTVTASKADADTETFESASVSVAVNPRTVALLLETRETAVTAGDPVTFTVTRGDTGDPVRATVAAENATLETDDNGTVAYTFEETGSATVTASKADTDTERFLRASLVLSVSPRDAVYEPGSTAGAYDADGDGRLSLRETARAATAYATEEISLREFGSVATAYARS